MRIELNVERPTGVILGLLRALHLGVLGLVLLLLWL